MNTLPLGPSEPKLQNTGRRNQITQKVTFNNWAYFGISKSKQTGSYIHIYKLSDPTITIKKSYLFMVCLTTPNGRMINE
jgi:hypothetical protein